MSASKVQQYVEYSNIQLGDMVMGKKFKSRAVLCVAVFMVFLAPLNTDTLKAAENDAVMGLQTRTEQIKQLDADAGNSSAPVVDIKYQGRSLAKALGGKIEYNLYVGSRDQRVSIFAEQGEGPTSLFYYIEKTDGSSESKGKEQLEPLWQTAGSSLYHEVLLEQDGKYVLYAKAAAGNSQAAYARTDGIVVDTVSPVITGIQEGGAYPLGTKFGVEDDNLDTVLVNEQPVTASAEDGMYQVAANGTSCVVRAKDKAGHETTCSITIIGEGEKLGGDEPKDDISVITKSGSYNLSAKTAYRLGSGSWTLEGESVVYNGGVTFYVRKDGDYKFKQN